MQPKYEKPVVKKPDFAKEGKPCYDYRNMEKAGQYRGVGQRGKVGMDNSTSIETMPMKPTKTKVRRDHEG
jgi:hypothetical protein